MHRAQRRPGGNVRDGESERCHGARWHDTFRSWESFWIFSVLGCWLRICGCRGGGDMGDKF